MKLSVIIPVLNERSLLPETLEALETVTSLHEIIVVDGGSTDGTREWLQKRSTVRALDAACGKGEQLNAGASLATGDTLLFLHADCRLPSDAGSAVERALGDQVVAGCFRVRFAEARPHSLGIVAAGINFRTALFRTATGDQAIFVRRDIFEKIGRFPDWPLFEDVDLVRRVKRAGKFAVLESRVTISARRYVSGGVFKTTLLMYVLRLGFWAGIPAVTLKRWFADVRPHGKPSPVLPSEGDRLL